jgi:hypothetical protein
MQGCNPENSVELQKLDNTEPSGEVNVSLAEGVTTRAQARSAKWREVLGAPMGSRDSLLCAVTRSGPEKGGCEVTTRNEREGSDYGRHTVVLHRYMRTVTCLCLDPNYWAIAFLRRPMARELARTGDGTKYQIITEATLVARNWQASSKVVATT